MGSRKRFTFTVFNLLIHSGASREYVNQRMLNLQMSRVNCSYSAGTYSLPWIPNHIPSKQPRRNYSRSSQNAAIWEKKPLRPGKPRSGKLISYGKNAIWQNIFSKLTFFYPFLLLFPIFSYLKLSYMLLQMFPVIKGYISAHKNMEIGNNNEKEEFYLR